MTSQAIGIFDSGLGGLSIWKEIIKRLPLENTCYLADSKNAPYGKKSKDEIISLSKKNIDYLLNLNCKIIVVACNTATTNAIKELRAFYDIPIIGIEPAIKPATIKTKTKVVGILATQGTLSSELFHQTTNRYSNGITFVEQMGTGIVELIESGKTNSLAMEKLLKKYLAPMVAAQMDYLVLGCSHYPFLMPMLRKLLPPEVNIIDSGEAVANQTAMILAQHNLANNDANVHHRLYINTSLTGLNRIVPDQPNIFKEIRSF
ncbi:glutamate racemase [Flavobacteriaceae bacterium F08102]|nr:glutamate racemase [Flavobacteriaceae bacterium F08102]